MKRLIFLAAILFLLPFFIVGQTCSLSLNTSSINYGTLAQSATSEPVAIRITNSGTDAGSLSVSSSDWSDGVHSIAVGATRWSILTFNYDTAQSLTTGTATVLASLPVGFNADVFLGVRIPVDSYAGTYSQAITITLGC